NITKEANRFAVAIPMLTKQISIMGTQQSGSRINDSYVRARNHVEELKNFYYSLVSYFFVIPFLIFINYRTYWEFQWFWFPMLGWALGLVIQAFRVFISDKFFGGEWEKRKIEQFTKEGQQKRWH